MGYVYVCLNCGNFVELQRRKKNVFCDVCDSFMTLRYRSQKTRKGHIILKNFMPFGDEDVE
jgi:hypothetical protein